MQKHQVRDRSAKNRCARKKIKNKTKEWLCRYAPVEAASLAVNLTASWLAYCATDNPGLSAISGAVAGMTVYYGFCTVREFRYHWRRRNKQAPYLVRLTGATSRTIRDVAVEFGIFGALDGFMTRPAIMFALSEATSIYALNIVLGKLAADALYYTFAIGGYELKKKYWRTTAKSATATLSQ